MNDSGSRAGSGRVDRRRFPYKYRDKLMMLRRGATCLRDERWCRGMKPDSYGLRGLRIVLQHAALHRDDVEASDASLHRDAVPLGLLKAKCYHS